MNHLPLLPAILVEVGGSIADLILAFLAARYAWKLTRLKPDNLLWQYLFYVAAATSAFAAARAVGHIAREGLNLMGRDDLWLMIAPWAGSFNTVCMVAVAAVTLFYQKGVQSYDALETESARLRESEIRLAALNRVLEDRARERAERLAKTEKRFRHLFRDSNDIIFFTDADGRVLDLNPAGRRKLRCGPEDPDRLSFPELFTPEDFDQLKRGLELRGSLHDFECPLRRRDGDLFPVLLSTTALYDHEGSFLGTENIAKDLTRLKSMTAQLVASEKMATLGQMAAGIAHEINTPLGVILGYAQLMLDDFPKDSEPYRNLEAIERQAKTSRRIVSDLLGYARRADGERVALRLDDIVEDVLAIAGRALTKNNVVLLREFPPDLPPAHGDPEQIRQIVINLVNNAGHAMEDCGGGLLLLRGFPGPDGASVCLEARDSGPGIDREHRVRLFTPFFTTKPAGKGTGLGLSVSQAIAEDHGGGLSCESPASWPDAPDMPEGAVRGPGASFVLRLPRRREEQAGA